MDFPSSFAAFSRAAFMKSLPGPVGQQQIVREGATPFSAFAK